MKLKIAIAYIILLIVIWFLSSLIPVQVTVKFDKLILPDQDTSQVFWTELGQESFPEEQSQKSVYVPAIGSVQFFIPQMISGFRFDPIGGSGKIAFHSMCAQFLFAEVTCLAGPQLKIWKEIYNAHLVSENEISLTLQTDDDPQFIFDGHWFDQSKVERLRVAFVFILGIIFILILLLRSRSRNQKIGVGIILLIVLFIGFWFSKSNIHLGQLQSEPFHPFKTGVFPILKEHLFDRNGKPLTSKDGNFALVLDQNTIYKNYPNQDAIGLVTDSQGFRNSLMNSNVDRIHQRGIILGGSAAFGWRLTNESDTIDGILNQSDQVRFANLGVVGYNSTQELTTFVHYGMQIEPQYVVALSAWNDFREYAFKNFEILDGIGSIFFEVQSRLGNYYNQLSTWNKPQMAKITKRSAPNMQTLAEAFFQRAAKVERISIGLGARYLLLIQPDLRLKKNLSPDEALIMKKINGNTDGGLDKAQDYLAYTVAIEELCRSKKMTCINLATHKVFTDSSENLFVDNVHLSPMGSLKVAEIIRKTFDFK